MRLLLTVTGPREVPTALEAGADLVDVKDTSRGSLGAPSDATLRRVARRLADRASLGVALGDGPHAPGELSARVAAAVRDGAEYLKVGLLAQGERGPRPRPAGRPEPAHGAAAAALRVARRARDAAGRDAVLVAVTFADAADGAAPTPEGLVEVAASAGADGVMLDTRGKGAGSVVDVAGRARLRRWCRAARSRGLLSAVAGGLDARGLAGLRGVPVDVVGIRGGACVGGRGGRLDAGRCRAIRHAVDRLGEAVAAEA